MARPITTTRGALVTAAHEALRYLTRLGDGDGDEDGRRPRRGRGRALQAVRDRLAAALEGVTPPAPIPPAGIKTIRRRQGWTQAELAAHLGVSHTAVAHWEQGRRRPAATARRLLHQLRREQGRDQDQVGKIVTR